MKPDPLPARWPGAGVVTPRLHAYADLLRTEQLGRGLGRAEGAHLWERHIVDSLSALPLTTGIRRAADLGTGVGLPGLPLAVATPWVAWTLVEVRAARAAWVRSAADRLGLTNVEVVSARWQDAPARRYDVVTARAVAPPDRIRALLASGPPADRAWLYVGGGARSSPGETESVVDSDHGVIDIDLS